jgi:NADP-dependent aldehyde dehydrogenase
MTPSVTTRDLRSGETRDLGLEESTPQDVAQYCAVAASSGYGERPLTWRADLLDAMATELEGRAEGIVACADRETALGLPRLEGELRRTVYQFRFFANVVRDGAFLGAVIDHAADSPMGPLPDLRRMAIPLGPVGVFGASNFPLAFSVPGGDTASALAAGCPVVIKAHPAHPETSELTFGCLIRAAQAMGAPDGTVALVHGFDAGVSLVTDSHISAVGFTGSFGAGQALFRLANNRQTPIPFYGELGSANPLVVTPDAAAMRAEEIGQGAAASLTLGVGQFCTQPGLLFVPMGADGDVLVAALVSALANVETGTMLTTGIAASYAMGVQDIASVPGAKQLVGAATGAGQANPALIEVDSAIFASPEGARLRQECFGPMSVVVRYANLDELHRTLAACESSLTFTVHIGDEHDEALSDLLKLGTTKAGRVLVNGYPTGVGVNWAQQHGGPWPSTTNSLHTSVGAAGIARWLRPVAFQNIPDAALPLALQEANPLHIPRRVDGSAQ